jgi:protein TonB
LTFGDGRPGLGRLGGFDSGGGDRTAGGNADWSGAETMMRLVVSAKPRYPDRLRTAGVNGRVRIRFVVDTTGRVDPTSVQILESTHELFTTAVRDILPSLRFKPSEANGQRVRSLAEMPFEFQITR